MCVHLPVHPYVPWLLYVYDGDGDGDGDGDDDVHRNALYGVWL